MDATEQKLLTDAEEVQNLLNSKGWGVIHGKLKEKILDLQNINNLDVDKQDTLPQQLYGRKLASDLLFAWLRDDVFGFVEQQRANQESARPRTDDIIDREVERITSA